MRSSIILFKKKCIVALHNSSEIVEDLMAVGKPIQCHALGYSPFGCELITIIFDMKKKNPLQCKLKSRESSTIITQNICIYSTNDTLCDGQNEMRACSSNNIKKNSCKFPNCSFQAHVRGMLADNVILAKMNDWNVQWIRLAPFRYTNLLFTIK